MLSLLRIPNFLLIKFIRMFKNIFLITLRADGFYRCKVIVAQLPISGPNGLM